MVDLFFGLGVVINTMDTDTWHGRLWSSNGCVWSDLHYGGSQRVEESGGVAIRDGMGAVVLD